MEPSDRKLGPEVSVAPRCGCSTAPSPDRLRHIEPESDPNQHPAAWPLRERGALRLDGDFGSVVVKLLPVLAQPTHFMLPTRPHRPQQPPERLLVAWLAQVTQLVNDDVVQDVGGCKQQAPREGKVPAARARPPARPRVTDGDGSKFEAETLRFLANDFSHATSGLAAVPAFDGRGCLEHLRRDRGGGWLPHRQERDHPRDRVPPADRPGLRAAPCSRSARPSG